MRYRYSYNGWRVTGDGTYYSGSRIELSRRVATMVGDKPVFECMFGSMLIRSVKVSDGRYGTFGRGEKKSSEERCEEGRDWR